MGSHLTITLRLPVEESYISSLQAVFRERVEAAGYTSALVRLLHSSSPQLQVLATKALARVRSFLVFKSS